MSVREDGGLNNDNILELQQTINGLTDREVFDANGPWDFPVTQGIGTVNTSPSSYGWQHARAVRHGLDISNYMAWVRIEIGEGSAGTSGQAIEIDFGPFLNLLDIATFGGEFRGAPGMPIGHAAIVVGGDVDPEPYHLVTHGSDVGSQVVRLLAPDGTFAGADAGLIEGDAFEIQIECFLFTD